MMATLVDSGDTEGLRMLSQQFISNAWYGVRFGMHNEMGIHGACPSEMLHALLLGWFLYLRKMFFARTGPDSELSNILNAIAKQLGKFFQHQSDRDMPRTNFSKGIKKGKLMAKEYSGMLLVLLAVLRSSAGQHALLSSRTRKFSKQADIDDWVMLIERLLGWECWLRQERLAVGEVKRSRRKHRATMALFQRVGKRTEGMGFKIMKYHVVLHLSTDIMNFGVPNCVDTGTNESHHKPSKTAAKQTQKNAKRFEMQTAIRIQDNRAIEIAIVEIDQRRKLWEYYFMESTGQSSSGSAMDEASVRSDGTPPITVTTNGGTSFRFSTRQCGQDIFYDYKPNKSRSKYRNLMLFDPQLIRFIGENIFDNLDGIDELFGFSSHKRNDTIFRAHPNFRGEGSWFDWVMVDWGRPYGVHPAQIWAFLDLTNIPVGTNIDLGEGMRLNVPGTYAVVESALPIEDPVEIEKSQFFIPYRKVTVSVEPLQRQFYLVDVDSFSAPVCVLPDMGGAADSFLRMQPRSQWLDIYTDWLKSPHENIDDVLFD